MYLVLLFTAAALLGSTCQSANVDRIKLFSEIDNNIVERAGITKRGRTPHLLKITQRPSSTYTLKPGAILWLTCEATGVPSPSIRWYKNDAPIYENELESNEISESKTVTLGRIQHTILVSRATGEDTYTCLATSGVQTARAITTVYGTDDPSKDISERTKLFPLEPHIVFYYLMYANSIGNTIALPCRVKGHPKPQITWRNNRGAVVKNDPRMKVLRSGELVISPLQWSDMGMYTCEANNAFGSQDAKTFLYPAKPQ